MDIDNRIYCSKCLQEMQEEGVCPHCGYDQKEAKNTSALDRGTLLNGRYQLGTAIGRGGFSITYAGWDEILGAPVAIKEYFPMDFCTRNTDVSDEVIPLESKTAIYLDGLQRFQRESHLLAELQGVPNIVKVMDFFPENGTAYIVMEYVRGVPVDEWTAEKKLGAQEILDLMRPVLDSLVQTHRQGVMHRDLTPANILVCRDGSPKLIDFGSAADMERSAGTVVLTRKYAAVEQYGKEHGAQGPWTDVYGISAVLYKLLTGSEPQESVLRVYKDELVPPRKRGARIKKEQETALMNGLAPDPSRRTQSMEELRARLYHLRLPEEILRHRRTVRRAGLIAALLLAIIAVILANFSVGLPLGNGLLMGLRGDGWHVKGVSGSKAEQILPESVLGIPVTAVEQGAFQNDSRLGRVEIPGSVREIGDMAFYGCPELSAVTLKDGVKNIGAAGFASCPKLETVEVPESLETISGDAFYNSSEKLTMFGIRGSNAANYAWDAGYMFVDLSEMEFEPVEGGLMLTSLSSQAYNLVLPSRVNGVPVVAISENVSLGYAERLVLPEHLKAIPGNLNINMYVEEVVMGDEIREIGAHAFETCIMLREIRLPESLEVIGDYAFYLCLSLGPEIRIPDKVVSIGEYAFSDCESLETIRLPDSVKDIGEGCFQYDGALKEIRLPEGLEEIPKSAFEKTGLETVSIPASVKSVGELAFSESGLKYVLLPAAVEYVADRAFSSCEQLRWMEFLNDGVSFQSSLFNVVSPCSPAMFVGGRTGSAAEKEAADAGYPFERIDEWTFGLRLEGDTAYGDYEVQETDVRVPWFNEAENCPIVRTALFQDMMIVRSVRLPLFQTAIHELEFDECRKLEEIIPCGTITEIGEYGLRYCSALTSVSFGEGLESVGSEAFSGCDRLKEIRLPDSVTAIDSYALGFCGLEEFTIPAGVFVLKPFLQETKITNLSVPGTVSDAQAGIDNLPLLRTLTFEEGVVAFTRINACPELESVDFPSTLREMPETPFTGCDNLREVRVRNPQTDFSRVTDFPSSASIFGYPGSTAESFAGENGLPFIPIDTLPEKDS